MRAIPREDISNPNPAVGQRPGGSTTSVAPFVINSNDLSHSHEHVRVSGGRRVPAPPSKPRPCALFHGGGREMRHLARFAATEVFRRPSVRQLRAPTHSHDCTQTREHTVSPYLLEILSRPMIAWPQRQKWPFDEVLPPPALPPALFFPTNSPILLP